jgi:hypothetical protein
MKRHIIAVVVSLVVASAAFAGCDSEDKKNYDVTVAWNVAGGQGTTCAGMLNGPGVSEQVEFAKVAVTVYSASDDTTPIQQTVEVNCTDYQYTIPRLKRGNYIVELGAMAEFDGDYLPYYQDEVEIAAPAKDDYEGVLLQGKGKIAVSWSFDNLQMCGPNGVTEVEVEGTVVTDAPVPCEDGEVLIEDLYWEEHTVTVIGLDESGEETWMGDCEDNPFEVKPGQVFDAHAVLSEI